MEYFLDMGCKYLQLCLLRCTLRGFFTSEPKHFVVMDLVDQSTNKEIRFTLFNNGHKSYDELLNFLQSDKTTFFLEHDKDLLFSVSDLKETPIELFF